MATISQVQEIVYRTRFEDQSTAGAQAAAKAIEGVNQAVSNGEQVVTRSTRSASSLISQYDQQTKAANVLARTQRDLTAAQQAQAADAATGGAKQEALGRTVQTLTDRVSTLQGATVKHTVATKELGNSSAATANQMRQLAPQINDVITSLAGGASPFMVLTQQGGQITQIFGGVKNTLGAIATALGPVGLGAIAVGGSLLGMAISAETSARRLDTLGEHIRATHADYAALATVADQAAKSVAASYNVSTADARSASEAFSSSRSFSGSKSDLQDMIKLSADLARVMGTDVPDQARKLAGAFADPTTAARQYADSTTAVSEALVRQIDLLQRAGDKAGATALLNDALQKAFKGSAGEGTALQKAMEGLRESFTGAQQGGKSLADELGGFVSQQAAYVVTGLQVVIDKLKALRQYARESQVADTSPGGPEHVDGRSGLQALRDYWSTGSMATPPDPSTVKLGPVIPGRTERAVGLMQVLPSTAADLTPGLNPYVQDQNILAGLSVLKNYSAQGGSMQAGLAKYGGYGTNVAGASGYIGKVMGADISSLPTDTAGRIDYWGNFLGMPADMIAVGKRLAMVESSGQHYNTAAAAAAATPTILPEISVQAPAGAAGPRGYSDTVNDALRKAGAAGTTYIGRQNAEADLAGYSKALDELGPRTDANAKSFDTISAAAARLREELKSSLDPIGSVTRGLADQIPVLQAQTGAEKAVAEAVNAQRLAARPLGQGVSDAQAAAAQAAVLQTLEIEHQKQIRAIDLDTEANGRLAVAYGQGSTAVAQMQARIEAEKAARDTALPSTEAMRRQIEETTTARMRDLAVVADIATAQGLQTQRNDLETIQAETNLIGAQADVRERELSLLKQRQAIMSRPGADLGSATSQESLRLAAAAADARSQSALLTQSFNDLANVGQQAFDRIGSSITEAFANGQLKALKFGDIAKAVLSEVLQYALKIAVLNPILNALFGGTARPTVGSTLDSLGGSSGGGLLGTLLTGGIGALRAGGSGSSNIEIAGGGLGSGGATASSSSTLLTGAGYLGTGYKAGSMLFPETFGSLTDSVKGFFGFGSSTAGNSIFDAAGVSGAQAAGLGGDVFGGAGGQVADVFGDAGTIASQGVEAAKAGAEAAAAGAQAAESSASAVSGFASQAGTLIQAASKYLPYIGTAATVIFDIANGNYRGAGLVAGGAVAGAYIGSVVPVVGTALGAAIGAAVGGLVDALLPSHPKNPYQNTYLSAQGGQLAVGATVSQLETTDAAQAATQQFIDGVNNYMNAVHLKLANADGNIGAIGRGITGLDQVDDPAKLFERLRFTSSLDDGSNYDVAVKGSIPNMGFNNAQALQDELVKIANFSDNLTVLGAQLESTGQDLTAIRIASVKETSPLGTALDHEITHKDYANTDALQAAIQKVNDFVNGTMPSLVNPVFKTTSDVRQAVEAVEKTYHDAIDQASQWGLDTAGLVSGMAQAVSHVLEDSARTLDQNLMSLQARDLRATGGSAEQADLIDFDVSAANQRVAFAKSYTDTFGDAILTSQQFADKSALLEKTLSDERLAIQSKYATAAAATDKQGYDAAAQTVTASITSLRDYAMSLATSDSSPLSATDQYGTASRSFDAVAGAAAAGDANSLNQLSGYASTFLTTSRAVNGSGTAYANDYDKVLAAIQTSVAQDPDTLTASAYRATQEAQTDKLVDAMGAVRQEVAALRAEIQHQAAAA